MDEDGELLKDVEKWKNRRRQRKRVNASDDDTDTALSSVASVEQKDSDAAPSVPPVSRQPIGKRLQARFESAEKVNSTEQTNTQEQKDSFIKGTVSVSSKKDKSKSGAQKKTATLRKSAGCSSFGFTLENCADQTGLQLQSVDPESPAGIADLKKGDLLLEINNADVRSMTLSEAEKLVRDCLRMGHITMVLLSPGDGQMSKRSGKLKAAAAQFDKAQNGVDTDQKVLKTHPVPKQVEDGHIEEQEKATPADTSSLSTPKATPAVMTAREQKIEPVKPEKASNWASNSTDTTQFPSTPPSRNEIQEEKVAAADSKPRTTDGTMQFPAATAAAPKAESKILAAPMETVSRPKVTDHVAAAAGSPTVDASASHAMKGSRVQSLKSAYEGHISRDSPKVTSQRMSADIANLKLNKNQQTKQDAAALPRTYSADQYSELPTTTSRLTTVGQTLQQPEISQQPVPSAKSEPISIDVSPANAAQSNKSEVVINFRGQSRSGIVQEPRQQPVYAPPPSIDVPCFREPPQPFDNFKPLTSTASLPNQPREKRIPIELEKRPAPRSKLRPQEVSSDEPCVACWRPLGSGTAVRIESLKIHFHMACFRCCECGRALEMKNDGIDVEVRANNKLYCDRCSLVYKGFRSQRY